MAPRGPASLLLCLAEAQTLPGGRALGSAPGCPHYPPAGGLVSPSSPGGSLSCSPGGGVWGVQGEASSFPSPLLLAALTSPMHLPPLGPLHTPLPHQQLPTHISLYLALLQISQKNPRSHSPCLSPLVPQAGPAPVGPASWSLLSPPSHPPPSTSLLGRSQEASQVPARCSSGPPAAKALRLKSGPPLLRPPPFLPLLTHSFISQKRWAPKPLPSWSLGVKGLRPTANTLGWPWCGR